MPGTANRALRWWIAGERSRTLDALVQDFDGELEGPRATARSRVGRKRFYRLAPADPGEPALFVKVFEVEPGFARWLGMVRPSKAQREANVATAVSARGFAVAAPVAVAEERRFGRLLRSVCVVPERGAADLRRKLSDPRLDRETRRRLLDGFAQLTRRMHDAGVDQDDTSPNNFLVEPDESFCLIDFERCSVGPPLPDERRHRLLAKLERHDLGVRLPERIRFLERYLGEGSGRGDLRALASAIERHFLEIRRNDARRAAAGAFQEGRHVGRRDGARGAEWFVHGRNAEHSERFELPTDEARGLWTLAHQLERLDLPAPRPVSLDDGGVLLTPAKGPPVSDPVAERLTRRFEKLGRFRRPGRFVDTPDGPLLADLGSFELPQAKR